MKLQLTTLLVASILAIACLGAYADNNARIDWINGVIVSSAESPINGTGNLSKPMEEATVLARGLAIDQMLSLIESTAAGTMNKGTNPLANKHVRAAVVEAIENSSTAKSDIVSTTDGLAMNVRLQAPITHIMGVLEKTAPALEPRAVPAPAPAPVITPTPAAAASGPAIVQTGPFTSVVIDSLGLKVDRAMSPKIRRADGSEVWGTVKVDYDYVEDNGIIVYARSLDDAKKNSRAGDNPLFIKAIDRAGGRFYCDAVISDDDAKLLLDENGKTKFLDEFKVIFVVDGQL